MIWKVRPTPKQIARGFLTSGILAEQGDPAGVGNVLALSISKQVLLPAQVGIRQRQDFAGLQRERHAAHRMDAAIGLAQAFD